MYNSDKIAEVMSAIIKVQGEIGPILAKTENEHYKSRYAELSDILKELNPLLKKHELALVHTTCLNDNKILIVQTIAYHSNEQYISVSHGIPAYKELKNGVIRFDAQTVGAASTYGKRYNIAGLFNLSIEQDDDGNSLISEGKSYKKESKPEKKEFGKIEFAEVDAKLQDMTTTEEIKIYKNQIWPHTVSEPQRKALEKNYFDPHFDRVRAKELERADYPNKDNIFDDSKAPG